MSLRNIIWNYGYSSFPYYAVETTPDWLFDKLKDPGNNCWIFISSDENKPARIRLLEKILSAVGVSPGKDAVLIFFPEGSGHFSLSPLLRKARDKKLISFGISLKKLGVQLDLPTHRIYELGGTELLQSVSLAELEKDKKLKAALWKALKTLFEI